MVWKRMEKVYPPYKKMTMFGSYVRFSGCSVFNDLFCFRVVFMIFVASSYTASYWPSYAASSQVFCCRIWRQKARFCPVWFLQKSLVWMPSLKKDLFGLKTTPVAENCGKLARLSFTRWWFHMCFYLFSPLPNGLKSPTSSAIHAKL